MPPHQPCVAAGLQGLGLFARAPIPCDTVLGSYAGRLRTPVEMQAKAQAAPLAGSYAFLTRAFGGSRCTPGCVQHWSLWTEAAAPLADLSCFCSDPGGLLLWTSASAPRLPQPRADAAAAAPRPTPRLATGGGGGGGGGVGLQQMGAPVAAGRRRKPTPFGECTWARSRRPSSYVRGRGCGCTPGVALSASDWPLAPRVTLAPGQSPQARSLRPRVRPQAAA
jgi:hypothetical protein